MQRIKEVFASHFEHWGIELPAEEILSRSPGSLQDSGWHISYNWGRDEIGEYLDYYAYHRMTNDSHIRIYETGATKSFPPIHDFRVCADDPETDSQLEAEHVKKNREVARIVRLKGL